MHDRTCTIAVVVTLSALFAAPSSGEPALGTGKGGPKELIVRDAALPSVTILPSREVESILGKEVRSSADEKMGRIVDVVVDKSGRVRAAVIDFGGFLGVGSRKIVVDWNALHFGSVANKRDSITLELTKEQVTAAPEYKQDAPVIVLGAAGRLQPWDFDH
jgi:sporulation protein YlmC with PRC-barrel domain